MEREKIRAACMYVGKTLRQVAQEMGTTPQNLNNKMKTGTLRDEDYKKIAAALGAKYVSYIEFPDGTKI